MVQDWPPGLPGPSLVYLVSSLPAVTHQYDCVKLGVLSGGISGGQFWCADLGSNNYHPILISEAHADTKTQ
jgi:hypothetical protein